MNYPLPQQPYPQQQFAPQYPQPPAQQYTPQGYPQQPYPAYPAPAPAAAPLAQGTIDEFYSQPTGASGPGISWKNKPIGTTYVGLVARDVTQGDIQQDVDFTTKQPKFRQGRPVFVMKVPLLVQPCQEFPEGEFTFWVRGQSREELVRAMAQVGLEGAPKANALIQVTLVQRKPNNTGNPTNIVQIQYTPDYNQVPALPAPVQAQAAPQQYAQPVQQQFQQAPAPQYAAPQPTPAPQPVAQQPQVQYAQGPAQPPTQQAPVQQAAPVAPAPAPAPAQQGAPAPQPPAGLDPNAAAILQQLTAQPA